eukprot:5333063-Amphidinium_carterae.1
MPLEMRPACPRLPPIWSRWQGNCMMSTKSKVDSMKAANLTDCTLSTPHRRPSPHIMLISSPSMHMSRALIVSPKCGCFATHVNRPSFHPKHWRTLAD